MVEILIIKWLEWWRLIAHSFRTPIYEKTIGDGDAVGGIGAGAGGILLFTHYSSVFRCKRQNLVHLHVGHMLESHLMHVSEDHLESFVQVFVVKGSISERIAHGD